MLVGSVLGLLAFLLAVTMTMASDRFDTRRALVLEETNSIGTTYLRAGFLDEPYAGDIRKLLREYVPLRVTVNDRTQYLANQEASIAILNQIWKQAEEVTRAHPESEAVSLFIETLNDTIDLQTTRATAVILARVPETILILLFLGEVLAMGIVGYSAGLTGQPRPGGGADAGPGLQRGPHPAGGPRPAARRLPPGQPAAADHPVRAARATLAGSVVPAVSPALA